MKEPPGRAVVTRFLLRLGHLSWGFPPNLSLVWGAFVFPLGLSRALKAPLVIHRVVEE